MNSDDYFVLVGMIESRLKKLYARNLQELLSNDVYGLKQADINHLFRHGLIALDKEKEKIGLEIKEFFDIYEIVRGGRRE